MEWRDPNLYVFLDGDIHLIKAWHQEWITSLELECQDAHHDVSLHKSCITGAAGTCFSIWRLWRLESMRFIMYVEGRVNWIDTDVTLLWPTLVQPVYWFPFTLFELDFEHKDKPGFSNFLVFSNKGLATNYKSLDQNHNKLSPELKGRIQQLRSQIQQLMRLSTTRQGWRGRSLLTCLEVAFMTLVRHAES